MYSKEPVLKVLDELFEDNTYKILSKAYNRSITYKDMSVLYD